MKTFILVLVIAITSAFGVQTQPRKTMAENTHALVGPVRSVRAETATFVLKDGQWVEGPRLMQMSASFNEDGNRTDLYLYDFRGALTRRIEMKYEGRRMLEFIRGSSFYRGKNNPQNHTNYTSDPCAFASLLESLVVARLHWPSVVG